MKSISTLLIFLFSTGAFLVQAQVQLRISQRIIATDTITDEGVTFAASSDDAEQENDEIDALFDDDIDAGWEGEPDDLNILTAGMRFQNLQIPQGATIDSAYIIVSSHETKTADDIAMLTIVGEDSDNPETFTEDALITDRPRSQAAIEWTVAEEWGLWTFHRTVDLSAIVQEYVNRDGWEPGNAMSFIFLGQDQGPSEVENAREWESFENISDPEDGGDGQNYPTRVPELVIVYTASNAVLERAIVVTDTVTDEGVTFAASSDDAEQENDEIDALFDDDIDAGWEGEPEDLNILTAGMRFQNITIPQGATIDSAFVEVYSHETKTPEDVARITIVGDATDDAETFTEDALITDRPQTETSILWEVAEEWGLWTPHRTLDVGPIIQELVNRDGWVSGNDIALIFLGEDQGPSEVENAREWESFENISDPEDGGDGQNYPSRRPRIFIHFSDGTTSIFTPTVQVEPLKLYPNPAMDMIQIELEGTGSSNVRILDNSGKLMQHQIFQSGNRLTVDVSNLPAGVYQILAYQAGNNYAQRLIKN